MSTWDTGLFDCFSNPKVCVISWFCGPCQGAYQMAGVEDRECTPVDLILMIFCGFCCIIKTRGLIRDKFGIEGSLVMDILHIWCCGICAISQQTRQLDIKGIKPAGFLMD
eukprot:TRINITY_DN21_c0_g1_i3.p1 TRINITY_DN21_c0_g1~~TRINITY_DN21_c0_g1_i3.p1  ORF type:complete len:124 (+),score=17.52 TRINITY_DN21_c0_g1_i3:44-373(+)